MSLFTGCRRGGGPSAGAREKEDAPSDPRCGGHGKGGHTKNPGGADKRRPSNARAQEKVKRRKEVAVGRGTSRKNWGVNEATGHVRTARRSSRKRKITRPFRTPTRRRGPTGWADFKKRNTAHKERTSRRDSYNPYCRQRRISERRWLKTETGDGRAMGGNYDL